MAKISARGAHKVATWKKEVTRNDGSRVIAYLTLCSDGRVLTKTDFVYTYPHTGQYRSAGSYTILAKNGTRENVEAFAAKRGYTRSTR